MNPHNLAELLSDLLVLTSRSTPLLADVSVYQDLQLILNQATHLFVHPPTPHKNATFTAICEVFNTWLRGINDLSKELVLAVWLADSIWRYVVDC